VSSLEHIAVVGGAAPLHRALRAAGLSIAAGDATDREALRGLCRGAGVLLDARPIGDDQPLEVALELGLPAAALTADPDRLVRLRGRFHEAALAAGVPLVVGLEAGSAAAELVAVGLAEAPALGPLEAITEVTVRWLFDSPGDALAALSGDGWTWESGQRTRRSAGGPPELGGERAALWIPSGAAVTLPWRLPTRRVDVSVSLPLRLGRPASLLVAMGAGRVGRRLGRTAGAQLQIALEGRGVRRVRREATVTLGDRAALTAALAATAVRALLDGEVAPGVCGPGRCPGAAGLASLDWTPPRQVDL